jgi:hypothetical protein
MRQDKKAKRQADIHSGAPLAMPSCKNVLDMLRRHRFTRRILKEDEFRYWRPQNAIFLLLLISAFFRALKRE